MQGGFETRPYKVARRGVVCRGDALRRPVAANEGEAVPRPHRIAHATLRLVGAGFKPALAQQTRRVEFDQIVISAVRWLPMQGGFETRPYKIARRVVVCRADALRCPVAANEGQGGASPLQDR